MEERFLEQALKDSVEKLISANIQIEIDEKVRLFKEELQSRKDKYIAEVMKGIRIYHEREPKTMQMNYKITFENIIKIEGGK